MLLRQAKYFAACAFDSFASRACAPEVGFLVCLVFDARAAKAPYETPHMYGPV